MPKKEITLKKLIVLFCATSILILILPYSGLANWLHPKIWSIQVFFFCTFLIGFRINRIGLSRPPQQFHIFYFIAMSIRFFLSVIFVFIMVLSTNNQTVVFVSDFIALYLLYSWFEIYFLIHNLHAD